MEQQFTDYLNFMNENIQKEKLKTPTRLKNAFDQFFNI